MIVEFQPLTPLGFDALVSDYDDRRLAIEEVMRAMYAAAETAGVSSATISFDSRMEPDETTIRVSALFQSPVADPDLVLDGWRAEAIAEVEDQGAEVPAPIVALSVSIAGVSSMTARLTNDGSLRATIAAVGSMIGNLVRHADAPMSQYGYAESLGNSTTTSSSYVNKLTLTTGQLPAGRYLIMWSAGQQSQKENSPVGIRVQVDGSTTLCDYSSNYANKNFYFDRAGMGEVTLGAGVHTLTIDHKTDTGGAGQASDLKNARLAMWRVG